MASSTNGLTQEQLTKINRALLLERAGRLTPDQQEALDQLRADGRAPAKLAPPIEKPRADPFTAAKVGVDPSKFRLPEVVPPQEILPDVGGAAGAATGFSAGGPVGAVGGAALGGAAGESARQIISRFAGGRNIPQTSGEAAKGIALQGAIEGGIEGLTRGGAKLFRVGRNLIANRVSAREAGKALASELHAGNISPKELGDELTSAFDATLSKEGADLRAFKDKLIKENPSLNVPFSESKNVVNQEIGRLKRDIANFPSAGTVDPTTGKGSREGAVAFLEDFRQFFNRENFLEKGNLDDVFRERSRAFNMSEVVKGELKGFEDNLSRSIHTDLGEALKKAGKGKEFLDFERLSSRFREVKELSEVDRHKALARVFGDKRIDAEKIADVLTQFPEDAIQAVKTLRQQGGEEAVAPVRKAIFLKILEKEKGGVVGTLLTDDAKVRAVFGPQAKKIQAFAKAVEQAELNKAGGGNLRRVVSFVTFPIASGLGGSPVRVGVNDAAGTVLEIPAKRLAEFLDNPTVFSAFTKAMSEKPSGAVAANLIRLLSIVATKERQEKNITTLGEVAEFNRRNKDTN